MTEDLLKQLQEKTAFRSKLKDGLSEIGQALLQTGVNPVIIVSVIRAIANIYYGTGHGKVQIFMVDGKITNIKPEESVLINQTAVVEETVVSSI